MYLLSMYLIVTLVVKIYNQQYHWIFHNLLFLYIKSVLVTFTTNHSSTHFMYVLLIQMYVSKISIYFS